MIFLNGFLFGMALQLSIGPVCFAVLHRSVSKGFIDALKMVCAVTLVDAAYILASFMGVAAILRIETLKRSILIIGACVLIYFGLTHFIRLFRKRGHVTIEDNGALAEGNSFIYGIKLTLVNPLTIVFWSGIFGSLAASGSLNGTIRILTYSLGCITSTMVFMGLVAAGGKLLAGFLGERSIKILDGVVGIFLVGFGLKMLFG